MQAPYILEKIKREEKNMIYLWVAVGGGIAALLRYVMSSQVTHWFGNSFPYGTFVVNVVGAFCIGVAIEVFAKTLPHTHELRAFIIVGILGGFTTFSTFSLEVFMLYQKGEWVLALAYILGSVMLAVLGVVLGLNCIRVLA